MVMPNCGTAVSLAPLIHVLLEAEGADFNVGALKEAAKALPKAKRKDK